MVVHAFDARPTLRIKASDQSGSFRRYGFVEAIQELDPVGTLGLLEPDFKVCIDRLLSVFKFFVLFLSFCLFLD